MGKFIDDGKTSNSKLSKMEDRGHTSSTDSAENSKVHKCRFCEYIAKEKRRLTIHERKHTGEKPFECKVCQATFISSSQLYGHQNSHKDKKPFQCDKCDSWFNYQSAMKKHMARHDESLKESFKIHQCNDCDFKTDTAAHLKLHIRRNHTGEKPFECDVCGFRVASQGQLNMHMKHVHTDEKTHKCEICDLSYKYKSDLKIHMEGHEDRELQECEFCGFSTLDRRSFQRHMKKHKGAYLCKICKKDLCSKSSLDKHMARHYKKIGRVFKCKDCEEEFKDSMLYYDHRKTHVVYTDKECDRCGEKFNTLSKYLSHRAHHRNHPENLPIKCNQCSKTFANVKILKQHKQLHTGRFPCDYCSKSFDCADKLKRHTVVHIGEACDHCGIVFNGHSEKLRHEKEHFDSKGNIQFKCSECDTEHENGSDYASHYMEHYNKLPFVCGVCSRRFKSKLALMKHNNHAHTGIGYQRAPENRLQSQNSSISESDLEPNPDSETDSGDSDETGSDSDEDSKSSKTSEENHDHDNYYSNILKDEHTMDVENFSHSARNTLKSSETSLPLAVTVFKRSITDEDNIILVWLKKMESDILSIARNNPSRIVLICNETCSSSGQYSRGLNEAKFSVKSSSASSIHWKMYYFGLKNNNEIKDKQFKSYSEVEEIICKWRKTKELINIIRCSNKGIYPIVKDRLKYNVLLCNLSTSIT